MTRPTTIERIARLAILLVVPMAACTSMPEVPPVSETPSGMHEPGQFVWHDLVTLNPDRAATFYGALLGWEFEPSNKGEVYTIVKQDGVPIAGIISLRESKRDDDVSPQWLSYFSVADVDAAVATATQGGAIVDVKPFELKYRGRVASIIDNRGAFVAMVHSSSGDPPRTEPVYHRWLWTELWTDDVSASSDFYVSLTGVETEHKDLDDLGSYTLFVKGDRRLSGMVQIPDDRITPNWLPYIAVEDPAEVAGRVEALGGRVLVPADRAANSRAAIIADPSGAAFGVHRWPVDLESYPEASE